MLCFLKNGLIDEPQQHTLTVLSTLLGIDYENEYDRADRIAMMNDVGERLHRQGYVWTRAEAVAHFGDFQIDRLRQVAEHLKVLWHILNTADSGEFMVRPLHCRYTYEYHSRFGGYVYDHDGRLAKQDKTDKKVTIGQHVRERNHLSALLAQLRWTSSFARDDDAQQERRNGFSAIATMLSLFSSLCVSFCSAAVRGARAPRGRRQAGLLFVFGFPS